MIMPVLMMIAMIAPLAIPATAGAVDVFPVCTDPDVDKDSVVCQSKDEEAGSLVKTVVNTLLYVLGVIAVIMIIVGGIRYATSGGDASGIKGGKDTVLYAVIGLVVAILAYSIVNFVIGRF